MSERGRRSDKPAGEEPSKGQEQAVVRERPSGWKTFLRGDIFHGEEISVRPMHQQDVMRILGAVAERAIIAEQATKSIKELSGTGEEDLLARGEPAGNMTVEVAQRTKGEMELLDFLRGAIYDGLMEKTPKIFMVDAKSMAYLTDLETEDATIAELDNGATGGGVADNGIQFCMVITETKGVALAELFQRNGYQVFEHASGGGFQAEIGGVRMAFLFPLGSVREDGINEELKSKFGGTFGGKYGKEGHA